MGSYAAHHVSLQRVHAEAEEDPGRNEDSSEEADKLKSCLAPVHVGQLGH